MPLWSHTFLHSWLARYANQNKQPRKTIHQYVDRVRGGTWQEWNNISGRLQNRIRGSHAYRKRPWYCLGICCEKTPFVLIVSGIARVDIFDATTSSVIRSLMKTICYFFLWKKCAMFLKATIKLISTCYKGIAHSWGDKFILHVYLNLHWKIKYLLL